MTATLRNYIGQASARYPLLWEVCVRLDNWLRGGRVLIRGRSNQVVLRSVRMTQTQIRIEGSNNYLEIGPGTRLFGSSICVRGDSHRVSIGEDCILGRLTLLVQGADCSVEIGPQTTSGSVNIDVGEPSLRLTIGRDCMISQDVEIMCGDAHSVHDKASGRRLNAPRDVVIGNHVWLAAQAAVLKGAVIGDHCVVGFRATVTSSVPAHSLAVGTPARVIRSEVTWQREISAKMNDSNVTGNE